MLTFTCLLTAPDGSEVPFSIAISESATGLSGEMNWGGSLVLLKHVHADTSESALNCMAKWPSDYVRTKIVAVSEPERRVLSIRIIGYPFDYTLPDADFPKFLEFLRKLELLEPLFLQYAEEVDLDKMLDELAPTLKYVHIYAGSRIYKKLPVMFTSCHVDGKAISTAVPQPLPGDVGIHLPVGLFPVRQIVHLEWSIEVGYVPRGAKLAVGAYRNSLNDRTFFTEHTLESFKSYSGSANLTI